jgi:cytidylate kinase
MIPGFSIPESKHVRVAISGRSGCGNTTVSRILAETLDISFINYTFRTLSQELHVPLSEIIERAKSDFSFDRMVDSKQIEMAKTDSCVLGSRLAIWLLSEADIKIYLTASEDVRSRRVMSREGGTFEDTRLFTAMRDREDTRRYRELYGIDNTDFSFADFVIDTETHSPEEIVLIILEKLADKGLVVRE